MRIENRNYNPSFKNGFYNITRELDASLPLSRALVDLIGTDIPWIVMANNKYERKEKARKLSQGFIVAWLSPFLTLPLSNRFAMKYVGKLTKNFWSNNHKAMHISNKYLKNADDMMQGLQNTVKKTTRAPLEILYNKLFPKKQYKQEINIDELLSICGGDKEKLRQKLIKSKNAVFFSDCIFTFGTIGAFPFLNNLLTEKESGQKGFSAEINMADKSIVEKRADNYDKTKKNKMLAYAMLLSAVTLSMSLAGFASLYTKKSNKFLNTLKDNADIFDYGKGLYMSRLPLLIGSITTQIGYIMASRNKTEKKDVAIRFGAGDAVFFGGDLLMASLFANLSDRVFKTELRKENEHKGLRKIFPKVKSVKQVLEEVESGKIKPVNKKLASGIFWSNLALIAVSMGYFIPKFVNRMIKTDVKKDADKQITASFKQYHIMDFVKS